MERTLLEKYPHVRPATHINDVPMAPGMVLAMHVTEDNRGICPFLGLDDRCTIYDDRPEVCRLFGNERHIFMTCSYQTSNGRIRDRAERRRIEKEQSEARKALTKR